MARGSTDRCCLFTSPLSTPNFNKTSHRPPHTPNSFTFKRVQTPLTQSPSRVQTQITHSLSRAQARFAPQGFWPSCPQAPAPYPIPGSYLTPSRVYGFILHIFQDTTRPSMCSYHVRCTIHWRFSSSFRSMIIMMLAPCTQEVGRSVRS